MEGAFLKIKKDQMWFKTQKLLITGKIWSVKTSVSDTEHESAWFQSST